MTGGASSCAALKGLPSAEQPRDRPGHAPAPDVQPQPAPAHGPVVAAAPVTVGSHVLTPPRPGPSRTGGTASRTGASRSTAALARQRATEASARSAGGTSGLYRAAPFSAEYSRATAHYSGVRLAFLCALAASIRPPARPGVRTGPVPVGPGPAWGPVVRPSGSPRCPATRRGRRRGCGWRTGRVKDQAELVNMGQPATVKTTRCTYTRR
jgi:hypothetical protein